MRVIVVSDSYPPLFGGATRAAQQLSRQLLWKGHQVTVATAWQRDLPALEQDNGVTVHRLRGLVSRVSSLSADSQRYTPPPFPDPEMVWRLRRLFRTFQPDLVHCYGWMAYSCLPALWRTDIPMMLAAREYANICAVRTLVRRGRTEENICSGPGWSKCLNCAGDFYGQPKGAVAASSVILQRRLLRRRVDALHSVSRFCEEAMHRNLFATRTPPSAVLPDFREDEIEPPPDEAILGQLPAEPFILFVGSFRRIKGDELLLEAYGRLVDPPPLVMIGARSAEPLPEFPPGVLPLIDVPHGTLMAIWDRALFGVCPSLWAEPLGNVIHEGMSRGKVVIGTRPSGHEDMIDDGDNGVLVPCGDRDALQQALTYLTADSEARERMGAAARIRALAFDVDEVMPRIEAFCLATAAGRRGPAR